MIKKFEKETELSLDYVLPDYLGDIKRVLSVTPKCTPDAKFMLDGGAELSGNVDFEVLYIDFEGNLKSFSVPTGFDFSFNLENEKLEDCSLSVKITQCSHRVLSARKISFKGRALATLLAAVAKETLLELDGAEYDKRTVSVANAKFFEKRDNDYSTVLTLDERAGEGYEVLSSFGNVKIDETVLENGALTVRGEYIVGAIIKTADGRTFSIKTSIPFEEIVSTELEAGEMYADSVANISSINVFSDEEDKNKLNVSFVSDIFSKLDYNEEVEIISDAYYKDAMTVSEYVEQKNSSVSASLVKNVSFNVDIKSEQISEKGLCDVILSSLEPQNIDVEKRGSDIVFSGNLQLCGMACEINEALEMTYTPIKTSVPFEFFEKTGDLSYDECIANLIPYDYDVKIVDTSISISVFSHITLRGYKNSVNQAVKSIKRGEALAPRDKSVYTVAFPKNGESLFSLAKRYKTSREKIALDNDLSEETLSQNGSETLPKRLIIS